MKKFLILTTASFLVLSFASTPLITTPVYANWKDKFKEGAHKLEKGVKIVAEGTSCVATITHGGLGCDALSHDLASKKQDDKNQDDKNQEQKPETKTEQSKQKPSSGTPMTMSFLPGGRNPSSLIGDGGMGN